MNSAAKNLEEWALSSSLVLVAQMRRWQEEDTGEYGFVSSLVRHGDSVNEMLWLDGICDLVGAKKVLPIPNSMKVSRYAFGQEGKEIFHSFGGIPVSDTPLVIAVIDPFTIDSVIMGGTLAFGEEPKVVCVSPHAFGILQAQAERKDGRANPGSGDGCSLGEKIGFGFKGLLDRDTVCALWNLEIPYIPDFQIDAVMPIETAAGTVFCYAKTSRRMWVVTDSPLTDGLADSLLQKTGRETVVCAVSPDEFSRLGSLLSEEQGGKCRATDGLHIEAWDLTGGSRGGIYNQLIISGIELGASDLHCDPKSDKTRLRYRIDGTLYEQPPLPQGAYEEVLRATKIMGAMDQQKRLEYQSGAGWMAHAGERYDLRFEVGGMPCADGGKESLNVRFYNSRVASLSDLNLPHIDWKAIDWFLNQSAGMAVLSGPTGSGKTTSLYAMLNEIDTPSKSIVTIEQPVEKNFQNAKQISVSENGKISYVSALRSVLRQDPDVIMVGEIRDKESASIAVQAALTGHLVLTTLHANSADSILARMEFSFDIDKATLASAVRLLVAQRLVPKLCPFCKELAPPKHTEIELFPHVDIASPLIGKTKGCPACKFTGILGRTIVMETIPVDSAVEAMLFDGKSPQEISLYATRIGFKTLVHQATLLLLTGEIPLNHARLFVLRPI